MNEIPIINPDEIVIPYRKTFNTLDEGMTWAESVVRTGIGVQISRLRQDFFKRVLPNDRYFRVLGVQKNSANVCRRLEPNGVWNIEVETPGSSYPVCGIFGITDKTTKLLRFSAWYNRFLPYAVAMLKAEWHFPMARGIDYESINGYYGTCMGFVYLGQGNESIEGTDGKPGYDRILQTDQNLFNDCYTASMEVMSPQLPFDEAHRSCMVYVAQFRPDLISEMVEPGHWWFDHVNQCNEKMNRPRIKFKGRRRKTA